jgi:hypothetical protein
VGRPLGLVVWLGSGLSLCPVALVPSLLLGALGVDGLCVRRSVGGGGR